MEAELPALLTQTLSPDRDQRRGAEDKLSKLETQPGFSLALLRLVQQHSAPTAGPESRPLRSSASIYFKNLVRRSWDSEDEGKENSISLTDREAIKGHMVGLMCEAPADVQRQLSAALSIISNSDFPAKWQNLLPELISKFATSDLQVIHGVLLTANSIMKRFRYVFKTDALFSELKYVLELLQEPLLGLFKAMGDMLATPGATAQQLGVVMEALRLICRIFFSLNWQDLPEYFEDHMPEWMTLFAKHLSYENPLLVDADEENEPGPIEKLQAAVVENVNLYADKYEEEFQPHLPAFTTAIWGLLMKVGPLPKSDILATTSIRFLTNIVGKAMHVGLFSAEGTLHQIVQAIVVPNLQLRTSDEELFEDNAADYIQCDMEGSDSDTRRRCACDLVRAMCKHFDTQTTQICADHITRMLGEYSANPAANWRSKDAALHLVLAVTVRAQSAAQGVSATNPNINVMDIFTAHVLPELQQADIEDRPIVKADSIKFASTFRNQFPIETTRALMPLLVNHLVSQQVVVHTYAASCVERFLFTKVKDAAGASQPKFPRAELQPFLQNLLTALFAVIDNTANPENEYVMKAVMRVLSVAETDVIPVTAIVLEKLTGALGRVCANPRNPRFNHFLFESIAVLVKSVCSVDASATANFETLLFPPFQTVLQMEVAEFTPYVFQILAQLLDYRQGDGLSQAYEMLFAPLLHPSLWERKGNIPALSWLIQVYLKKGMAMIVERGHLEGILGVFQKLLASKATEGHAFSILSAVVEHAPLHAFQQYLPTILQLALMRLQQNKTPRYIFVFTQFCCLIVSKHEPNALVQHLEAQQAGLTTMIVQQIMLPNVTATRTPSETKVLVVGLVRMLCEVEQLAADGAQWCALLSGVLSIMEPKEIPKAEDDHDFPEEGIGESYDAAFSQLHFAGNSDHDALAAIPSTKHFLAQALRAAVAARPAQLQPLISQLPPEGQATWAALQG